MQNSGAKIFTIEEVSAEQSATNAEMRLIYVQPNN